MKWKSLFIGGTALLAIGGIYLSIGHYFLNLALNAKRDKQFLVDNPNLEEWTNINPEVLKAEEKSKGEFLSEHPPKVVTIKSKDSLKLKLSADLYENSEAESSWVIVVHAYSSQASDMVLWAENFHKQGFHVLAVNLRGHGESEGDYIGMGWHDRLDLLTWIKWILDQNSAAEIILFGLSMGAATVMMAAGEELPKNVKVIVEDCGYSSTTELFEYQMKEMFKSSFSLPISPILHAGNTVTKMKAGYNLKAAEPTRQLKRNTTPMLFIHGDQDTFVPFEMLFENYHATKGAKEYLIIPGAGHAESRRVAPELYWETIHNFINQYIATESVKVRG